VPKEAEAQMRCQYMKGDFCFTVQYGYSLVGRCVAGPQELLGRRVHTMHPHQDVCYVEAAAVFPVPDDVPAQRATLASNLETAVNAVWDSEAKAGERAAVIGFGVVGSLTARLFGTIPGTEITIVDSVAKKREIAAELGFAADSTVEPGSCDLAFECSGSPQGLQTAMNAVGAEGRVIVVSWYGDRDTVLHLGTDFHHGRKRIISSQVSKLPPAIAARWDYPRRKELVFRLLQSELFDRHVTDVFPFDELPRFFHHLCQGDFHGLSAAVQYSKIQER
jgi:threonine dehydrogenase-like Zn-dependent dehydrogenase